METGRSLDEEHSNECIQTNTEAKGSCIIEKDLLKNNERKEIEKEVFKIDMDKAMNLLGISFKKATNLTAGYLLPLNTKNKIEELVAKLQVLTNVSWSVKQSRQFEPCIKKKPKKPLTIFKRVYCCHMHTRVRSKTKEMRNRKSRNLNCPAQLIVSIKAYIASTQIKPKPEIFNEKFPCLFEFRNHHNHEIRVQSGLKPIDDVFEKTIFELLNKGHSVTSLINMLYTIENEDCQSTARVETDEKYLIRKGEISAIFKTHGFKEKYSDSLKVTNMHENLEQILALCQKKNGTLYKISIKDDIIAVCICTPIMQRVIPHASEVLFIHPSTDDYKHYKLYVILTQSSAGALPVSCIITNKNDLSAFSEGIKLFFKIVEIHPTVVLSNAEITSELIRQNFFPDAKLFYSIYHTLNSAWKILYKTRHELARNKKETYYQLFRDIVFADSAEELAVAKQVLAVECVNPRFVQYVDSLYENISLWCLYYRDCLDLNTDDYLKSELSYQSFRLISNIVLERTKSFNLNQITDFMAVAYEKFYRNRLLEIVIEKRSEVLHSRYDNEKTAVLPLKNIKNDQVLFSKGVPDQYFQVDVITGLCTCRLGAINKFCEHVAEILRKRKVFSPVLTLEERAAVCYIASGITVNKESFLPGYNRNLLDAFQFLCKT